MTRQPDRTRRAAPPGTTMDSLRRIERAQQRLWLLALLLLLLVTLALFVLDATSVTVERLLSGMTARLAGLLDSYGASAALLGVVFLVCAYFYEKLVMVRNQNRELVRALDTSAHILAQRNQQLDTWSQLSHSLITEFNLPRLLDLIVHTAAEVTQSDCAAVMLTEDRSPHLRLAAVHQGGLQMELTRRAAAMTIDTGKQVYLSPEDLPQELDRPDLAWENLASLAAAPLVAADNVVGALLVGRLRPHQPFSRQIVEALDSFANQASIALEKAHRYAENQKQLDRLATLLEDLRATQSQLVQSERLASLGTLATGVAHVINNPLAAVVARTNSLLESKDRPEEAVREDLQAIRRRALDMGETLKGFLTLSRRSENEPLQSLDLNEIVCQALDLLRQEFQASGLDIAESYGELPRALGHSFELQRVCVNLLVNASQAVRGGGRLEIRTAAPEAGWVSLQIEASSAAPISGAPGDELANLEPPEITASEVGPGLAGVERIIHSRGGRIEAVCEPGAATRFDVRLPVSVSPGEQAATEDKLLAVAGEPGVDF
ncbi:MAG: GAF domain-containing protein [Armatimonadota bacterium]|nr:MAG: GAF domain-containing protein [Armatimonadota bacterium]